MPRLLAYPLAVIFVAGSWAQAMVRSEPAVLDKLVRVFLEGFQLPWLGTLSRMAVQYVPFLDGQRASALPFLALAGALIYGIWTIRSPGESLAGPEVKMQESGK